MRRGRLLKKSYLCISVAYLIWGFAPIFWKQYTAYPQFYILNIRFFWSSVLLLTVLFLRGQGKLLRQLWNKKTILTFLICGAALYVNWLCNILAAFTGQLIELSMGQFLSPVLIIGLGAALFHEHLTRTEWLSVLFAVFGLAAILISYGKFPWVIGLVSFSFFVYVVFNKSSAFPALLMTLCELLVLAPLSGGICIYYECIGQGFFSTPSILSCLHPLAIAAVSGIPLLLYASAAKDLSIVALGFFQYSAPLLALLIGVFLYGEPVDNGKLISLGFIAVAVVIYLWAQRARPSHTKKSSS